MALDIDSNVCFHCNEKNVDMSAEVASLKQPLSEIEATFIMERCPTIDREYWRKILEKATTSHAATTSMYDLQPTVTITSNTEIELEICKICDLPYCESHSIKGLTSSSYVPDICLEMPICYSCFDECNVPSPCDCEEICRECMENFEARIEDDDISLDTNEDFQNFFISSVDWTKKNAGLLEELGISDPDVLGAQVLRILSASPNQFFEIFEEVLATETETANLLDETPIDRPLSPPVRLDSAIKFLMRIFLSNRFKQLLESHFAPEAVTMEGIEDIAVE